MIMMSRVEFIAVAPFVIIFIIQILLCFKVKSRIIRLLPMIILFLTAIVYLVLVSITPAGWDRLGYAILVAYAVVMIFICGIAWGIWAVKNYLRKK